MRAQSSGSVSLVALWHVDLSSSTTASPACKVDAWPSPEQGLQLNLLIYMAIDLLFFFFFNTIIWVSTLVVCGLPSHCWALFAGYANS